MSDIVGELYFDLTINKSKFDTELSSLESVAEKSAANIKNSFNQSFSALSSNTKTAMQSVENSAEQSSQSIKNNFNGTSSSVASQFTQSTQKMKTSAENLKDTVEKSNEEIKNSSESSSKSMSDNFKTSAKKIKSESDEAAASISDSFKKSAMNIKAAFDMVIGSIKSLISGCKSLMSAYQTQIEAETRLEATMRNSTSATDEQIQSVKNLAGELQGLGVVGDEVQLAGAQELATYVSNTESIKSMLPIMDDMIAQQYGYSASTESATTIATMLGKVLQGQTTALSRYGYSFTEAQEQLLKYGTEEERVATLAEVIEESVGDVNAALANTPTGRIKQLSNNLGDLKETLGNIITNVFYPIVKWLDIIVVKLNTVFSTLNNYVKELLGIEQENISGADIADIIDSADDASEAVDDTTDSVNALKKALAGFDQLNILSDSSSDDTSSSENTSTALALDTLAAQSDTEALIDNIQKKLQSFFKNSGFDDFVSEIQKSISEVDFVSIGENFQSIMQSLQPIAQATLQGTQKIFESTMKTLGKVIGGTAKVAGKSIQTISGGVAKWLEEDKDKIVEYVDTISTNVSSGIDNVGIFVDTVTTTAGNSIDRMRPQMENAIEQILSGITTFSGSMGVIFSEAFNTLTSVIAQWAIDNESKISTFFDNIQVIGADCMNGIGTVFQDVGDTMLSWWNDGGGAELWENICKAFMDVQTVFVDVFNNWIMPVWNALVTALQSAWNDCLAPIFEKVMDVLTKLWNEIIYPLWTNVLKPLVDWLVKTLGPIFESVFGTIGSICQTVFETIGGFIGGLLDSLGGLIDFVVGIFTGDWEKAWQGICDFFKGIWDAIWSVLKGILNLIIDGINLVWSGIYAVAKGIVDTIGGISGAIGSIFGQDWSFSMPDCPTIPKLAKGGLVTAPTLALVGDNPNATSDPEVVAPLSKLKTMISDEQQLGGNPEVLSMLKRIYDLLSSQETQYTNVIYLDSEEIERKLVKVRKRKTRRYGGATT